MEGITLDPSVVPCQFVDGGELVHEVDGGVVADIVGAAVPHIETVEEAFVNLLHRKVFDVQFRFEEFLHPVFADFVADECLLAIAVVLDGHLVFRDELVEEFNRGLDGFLLRCAELVLEGEGGNGLSDGLHVIVEAMHRGGNLREDFVGGALLGCLSTRPVSCGHPIVRKDILLG